MSYTRYDQSIYRTGFRPYGHTNPWAASQLNGISAGEAALAGLGQNAPFGPWRLHGSKDDAPLGQYHPFTERGGWALHGLGAMVPDQSLVTYQGKWAPTSFKQAQDVVAEVNGDLNSSGVLMVRDYSSTASWTQNTPGFPLSLAPFTVTLKLQVVNGQGFGDPNDIIAIVRHYVYQATGSFPTADTITGVQAPGSGAPTPTGEPDLTDQGPTDWSQWFQDNFTWIALLAGAVFVLPPLLGRR